ncbi:MAG: polyprenyl synthetase family protein [Marinilabiliales bacterium]|nr:MAG: polyprenyl synthetase family protein [Marinilabiliales bacterium]
MEITEELRKTIDREIEKMNFPGRQPAELYEPVHYIMSNGGKRIRPVISLMAGRMFGKDITPCVGPALALELFHNFTLMHDDIMDRADTRRGRPTVHKKWDTNTAILSGDALVVLSFELISATGADKLPKLLRIFNKTALEVCEGQQMDINFEKLKNVSEVDYMEMIKLKTSVLIAAAMEIGAITAGASDNQGALMYEAGLSLGLAFQLQDDLLDLYGSFEDFGKKPGGDIIMNKKTILLIRALERAGESKKGQIINLMEIESDPDKKVQYARELFDSLGVEGDVRETIEEYFSNAVEMLHKAGGDKTKTEEFIGLMNVVADRKS